MKGEVSDMIIVIGTIGIVLITVSTAYIGLDEVNLPTDEEQTVSGGVYEVSDDLARMVESCWRQSGKGSQPRQSDCFNVKIYSNDTVSEQNVTSMLQKVNGENFGLQGTVPKGESTAKVTYYPIEETVNISVINSCRPSQGDTCRITACTCQTACGPGFDPDGDGENETNEKGCITDYSFEPSEEPCESISCPPSSPETIETDKEIVEIDIGDKIGLRESVIMARPIPSPKERIKIDSNETFSPREKIGHGSSDRTLFEGKGTLNISSISPGSHELFIWSCDDSLTPENCRWLTYNLVVNQ